MKGVLFYIIGASLITFAAARWKTGKDPHSLNTDLKVCVFIGIAFIAGGVFYEFL